MVDSSPPSRLTRLGWSRGRLFFWLVLLATLNAFAGFAVRTVTDYGWTYALFELGGISAVLWIALAAALALLQLDDKEPVRPGDRVVAAFVVLFALSPFPPASSAALSALALWMLATAASGSPTRRAGVVALAMTTALLWGRVMLALFSRPLLGADTWLVGHLVGVEPVGNTLRFVDGTGAIAVAPGCSSWQGMSLALVFWATVNQWFGVRFGWRPVGWYLLALAATVLVNVVRIGAMVTFPAHIEEIHHGYGWHIAMWSTLTLVCAICLYGARRDVFTR